MESSPHGSLVLVRPFGGASSSAPPARSGAAFRPRTPLIESHSMDQEDKRRLLERYQRAMRKHRTFDEAKLIKEEARRRRVERGKGPRPRRRADDEELEFEPLETTRAASVRRSPAAEEGPGPVDSKGEQGLVVSIARTRVGIRFEEDRLEAVLPPGLDVAVGDRVAFERRDGGLMLVRRVLPRTSWLARPDPSVPSGRLLLAANVDLVVCVVAARQPRWKPGFVDRVLLAAEDGRVPVLIVINKLDLLLPEERRALAGELEPFVALGAGVLCLSAATGEGLSELSQATTNRTCAFVGPSGVGKSRLLNALDPNLARATGAVLESDGKGRHTTTASELVSLGNGAVLIDTPGVRQFGLIGLDRRTLAASFPEFAVPARACRFRDCSHLVEPACGVRAALEKGDVDRRRFESYRRIHASLEE